MATLKLTPKDKLQIINLIDTDETLTNRQISKHFSSSIKGITPKHIVKVNSTYKKNGYDYRQKIELELDLASKINKKYGELFDDVVIGFGKEDLKGDGVGKNHSRALIEKQVRISSVNYGINDGKYPILPSNKFGAVKRIYYSVSKKFNYMFCQRITNEDERNTFQHIFNNMTKYGKHNTIHGSDFSELIYGANENSFSHIGADYCGCLNTFKDEIKYAVLNNLVVVGGTIQVTMFNINRAPSTKEFTEKMLNLGYEFPSQEIKKGNKIVIKKPSKTEMANRSFFRYLSNLTDYEIVEEFTYVDSSPMLMVILRRLK